MNSNRPRWWLVTLVRVMVWCRQASSQCLCKCWYRSMSPCGVTWPQWVKAWPVDVLYHCSSRASADKMLSPYKLWIWYYEVQNWKWIFVTSGYLWWTVAPARPSVGHAAYIDLNWCLTQNPCSLPSKHIIIIYWVFIPFTLLHKALLVDFL